MVDVIDPISYFRDRIQKEVYESIQGFYTNGWVLDLGCASGPSWPFISNIHTVGLDLKLNGEARLRAKRYNVELIIADAHHLPFRSECISLVLCQEILEHLKRPTVTLKEVSRVLQDRSFLLIDVPSLLDKVTVPSLKPFAVLLEKMAVTIFRKPRDRRQEAMEANLTDLELAGWLYESIERIPIDYVKILAGRVLHLLNTVRYCMREHKNRYAWSWLRLIHKVGFSIERVEASLIFYPISLTLPNLERLYLLERNIRRKYPFKYLGQLLCVIARKRD